MSAETPNVRPGQEGPEGKLDSPVLGEWAQECPFMEDTVPRAQEQFLGCGGRGAHSFCCSSQRVNRLVPRTLLLLTAPPCWNVRVQGPCVSTNRGLHEEPGQVSATQAGAAVSASQEAGWGRGSTAQACFQGQVLTGASVPPQVHFSWFPSAKLSNPSRAGRSRTLGWAGELPEAQKGAQSRSGGSCRSPLETSGRISGVIGRDRSV